MTGPDLCNHRFREKNKKSQIAENKGSQPGEYNILRFPQFSRTAQ
jgi:hypothetical protein